MAGILLFFTSMSIRTKIQAIIITLLLAVLGIGAYKINSYIEHNRELEIKVAEQTKSINDLTTRLTVMADQLDKLNKSNQITAQTNLAEVTKIAKIDSNLVVKKIAVAKQVEIIKQNTTVDNTVIQQQIAQAYYDALVQAHDCIPSETTCTDSAQKE
jgi:hypothetical protein